MKVTQGCLTLCNPMDCSAWNFPGQNTEVGSLSLLQGIFSTQGWNPGLPHRRWILYQLSCKGSPRILEWVAYPFSSGSSRPRNRTGGSCIASRFFTNWAMTTEFKLSCVIISFRLKEKKRKMFYVTKTKECREKKVCPLLFFEKPRPLSPQRPLDFLSTCLGIDSLMASFDKFTVDHLAWKLKEFFISK